MGFVTNKARRTPFKPLAVKWHQNRSKETPKRLSTGSTKNRKMKTMWGREKYKEPKADVTVSAGEEL